MPWCSYSTYINSDWTIVATDKKIDCSKSLEIDCEVQAIWDKPIAKHNWLTAAHISRMLNMKTEQELTKQDLRTERGYLRKQYFELIVQKQGFESEIGLFASRINT